MNSKYAIETLTEAVNNIILPKFEKYVEDRKNDISLQPEVEAEVEKIEDYETLVIDLVSNLGKDFKNSINIGEYWFRYDPDLNTHVYANTKLESAKNTVYQKHGLVNYWQPRNGISTRVAAIITTLEETSFDEVVKIVESQIDFNEFLVKEQ